MKVKMPSHAASCLETQAGAENEREFFAVLCQKKVAGDRLTSEKM